MGFPVFGQWLTPWARSFGRVSAGGIKYLWRADFSKAQAAPLAGVYNPQPGPGPLFIGDSTNVWLVSNDELIPSALSVSISNPGIWHVNGFARIAGRTLKARVKNVSAYGTDANKTFSPMIGWCDIAGSTILIDFETISYWVASTKFQIFDSISVTSWNTIEGCLADTYNIFVSVLRAGGGVFHIVDGKLIGITRQNTDLNVHPEVTALGGNRNPPQVDYFKGADLGYPWNDDFGICTTQLPGARSVGNTFTHEGSCHIEFTITALPVAGSDIIIFRKQDANNHWRATVSTLGTVTVDEVTAGVPVTRISISSCAVNDRIVVSMNSTLLALYRDRPASGVTNASTFASSSYANNTNGEVNSLGTSGAIKDLYTYPYNLSGQALSLINNL